MEQEPKEEQIKDAVWLLHKTTGINPADIVFRQEVQIIRPSEVSELVDMVNNFWQSKYRKLEEENRQFKFILESGQHTLKNLEEQNSLLRGKVKELYGMLESINKIMWESHMIKDRGLKDSDGNKIMDVLENWANKY